MAERAAPEDAEADAEEIQSGPPPEVAGGWAAVAQTVRQVRSHAGLMRGSRALLLLNQPHGFDCPGCAWPEPGQHRSAFEFCENGAKAVAAETTRARADAA